MHNHTKTRFQLLWVVSTRLVFLPRQNTEFRYDVLKKPQQIYNQFELFGRNEALLIYYWFQITKFSVWA